MDNVIKDTFDNEHSICIDHYEFINDVISGIFFINENNDSPKLKIQKKTPQKVSLMINENINSNKNNKLPFDIQ